MGHLNPKIILSADELDSHFDTRGHEEGLRVGGKMSMLGWDIE